MLNKFARLVSTFFYVGEIPAAPGTIASFLGGCLYLVLNENQAGYWALFIVLTALGFALAGKEEKRLKVKDPGSIVIDEVSGAMIAFAFLPVKFPVLIVAFFLFRAFDMFKIFPANKMEDLGGAVGIMMDDIVAGIYTNLVMHAALKLAGIS